MSVIPVRNRLRTLDGSSSIPDRCPVPVRSLLCPLPAPMNNIWLFDREVLSQETCIKNFVPFI